MNLTKALVHSRLFTTPFRTSVLATCMSLIIITIIHVLLLPIKSLPLSLLMTVAVAAPVSYISSAAVINLRMEIEEERLKRTIEHERAQILAKFMGDAAHEFKTPLALMESSLYLLERSTDPEKKQRHSKITSEQIQALNKLLDTILILTRLDSTDKTSYSREPVNAAQLLSFVSSPHGERKIKLLINNPDTLPDLRVNLLDVHLAIKQITDNALRFSPTESEVTVEAVTLNQSFVIIIKDQGQGMSPETLQHIFERFYRVDESHTTRGLGLGLAIAKRVFELHDGHIEVQSELAKGTTVKAYLPISFK